MGNVLVIIGNGAGGSADVDALNTTAAALSERLNLPVLAGFLEASPSVGEAIQKSIAEHHPDCVVVLPLFVGVSLAKQKNAELIVDAARDRWREVTIYYGRFLGTHAGVIAAYSHQVQSLQISPDSDTALLVIGRGSQNTEANAEVYQLARLIWENFQCGMVETAFYETTQPDISTGIRRCVQAGMQRIIVVPYMLYEVSLHQAISAQLQQYDLLITDYPAIQMLEAIQQRYQEALIEGYARPMASAHHSHGTNTHTHRLDGLQALLPPRYQGAALVSASPMGAADLIFDADGNVAWDQIWGGFCDLALAGGPPHRGTLLEPVSSEMVRANLEGYLRVLAELERGIRLVTGLPVVISQSLGWIGVQCADETMALWLLRAIIVENISVRREGNVLYLPAGPDFRLEYEIKNVITVIAKTHHYWTEHITSDKQRQNP